MSVLVVDDNDWCFCCRLFSCSFCLRLMLKKLFVFSARQHICYSALYAIARPSVRHTGGSVKDG